MYSRRRMVSSCASISRLHFATRCTGCPLLRASSTKSLWQRSAVSVARPVHFRDVCGLPSSSISWSACQAPFCRSRWSDRAHDQSKAIRTSEISHICSSCLNKIPSHLRSEYQSWTIRTRTEDSCIPTRWRHFCEHLFKRRWENGSSSFYLLPFYLNFIWLLVPATWFRRIWLW